ncbi:hypothetical protein RUM43_009878 [Polyplax serrata]|uniref:Cadherin domain-containing protein n=1 Tax=Polyplax serrata TaxID=468196 RepID=A0AAN8S9V9_POLSC
MYTKKVRVDVLDKNDSPPSFRNVQLNFSISEDLPAGHVISRIQAEDPDTIGEISYQLIDGGDEKFDIEPSTGRLRLNDSLDRETKDLYKLQLRASDGIQYTDAIIKITVTDTNDNSPVFPDNAYSFDVPENTARGTRVGEIAAVDEDEGLNGQITYQVISDWANDVFNLNPQSGVFTLTARLDYEEVQHYIFVVQAQDMGKPSLSSTVTVYFNIVDLNDNAPLFDPMSYNNEVFENVTIGTNVVTVSATDLDSGLLFSLENPLYNSVTVIKIIWTLRSGSPGGVLIQVALHQFPRVKGRNGEIEYRITSGDENQDLAIAQNGTIYTVKNLDRETKSVYNLLVTGTDLADEPQQRLSSTVQVSIVVKDVNDMSAEFITPNATSVSENIPVNTVVLAIKAIDKDEGRNSYLEYSLYDPSKTFTVGPVDGLLKVVGRLDRETRANYSLEVTAKDRGDPPRSSKQTILINVLDENDNSPMFDPKHYSASIAENASIGTSVLQVSATDVDEGANGRVRYSIFLGDENRDFSISEDTGVVRVAKNLNFERKSRYLLTVRAEDSSHDDEDNVRYDTATISIIIRDINDNPPTFLDSPYIAYVMENTVPQPDGYFLTVRASDADTPQYNGQVRYFLKEGDAGLFRINASTGDFSLLKALDRETQSEYLLTVVAMDTGLRYSSRAELRCSVVGLSRSGGCSAGWHDDRITV